MFNADEAVGMPVVEAVEWFAERGFTMRIVRLMGVALITTRDFRRDRVNVHVSEGRVQEVTGVG
jgi:hypothetical protein